MPYGCGGSSTATNARYRRIPDHRRWTTIVRLLLHLALRIAWRIMIGRSHVCACDRVGASMLAPCAGILQFMNYPDDDFKAFKAWASDNGVPYQPPTPLSSLLRFIGAMMHAGKSYSTIEHRVFGVSAYNVRHGQPGLAKNDQIKGALNAALLNIEHTARIRKDALLPEGLRKALSAVRSEAQTPAALRDVAILTLARATGAKPGDDLVPRRRTSPRQRHARARPSWGRGCVVAARRAGLGLRALCGHGDARLPRRAPRGTRYRAALLQRHQVGRPFHRALEAAGALHGAQERRAPCRDGPDQVRRPIDSPRPDRRDGREPWARSSADSARRRIFRDTPSRTVYPDGECPWPAPFEARLDVKVSDERAAGKE